MKQIGLSFIIALFSFCMFAMGDTLSPRIANYDMDVTLDIVEKKLSGNTKLTWKNPGSSKVTELQFHLYYNAFKNSE